MKFFPSVNIEIKRTDLIKKGEEYIAQTVRANFVKNRFSTPYKKVNYNLYFGEGIRKSEEAVEVAKELGIITGKGWYVFPISETETEKRQGLENVINWYQDNPEAFKYLESLVLAYFNSNKSSVVEEDDGDSEDDLDD